MKVRMYGYNVPIQGPCVECGQPFKGGDSITLNPARERLDAYCRDCHARNEHGDA